MKNRSYELIIILLVVFAVFFRFFNYPTRYGIGYDGSRDAIVSFEAVKQLQLPATGPFYSIGPITFGPWYYYYFIISNLVIPSFFAPWISVGIASLGTSVFLYFIGKKLIDTKFGIILLFISVFSPAQISASINLQPHALIGFLSTLTIYIFIFLYKSEKKKYKWLPLIWGFVMGIAINTHLQTVGLFTLPALFFIFKRDLKSFLKFSSGLFIALLPLLIFELNNHWFNSKNIIDYLRFGQYRIWTSNRWLTFISKFWPEFIQFVLGTPVVINLGIMIGSSITIIYGFFKRRFTGEFIILTVSFVIQVLIIRYYRGEKFFGYLQFFHPFVFLYTGLLIYEIFRLINNRFIVILLSFGYLLSVIPTNFILLKNEETNMETRKRIDILTTSFPDYKFSAYECKNTYDRNRLQALLLFLYMNRLYDANGIKISINNPACLLPNNSSKHADITEFTKTEDTDLKLLGFQKLTPEDIYTDVARWWFKEQP